MKWYSLILDCDHVVYVRLEDDARPPEFEWLAQCPREAKANRKAGADKETAPLSWRKILIVEEVSDEYVSNVRSGESFLMSRNILRLDAGYGVNNFPYRESK